jgi:iron-sulfur cluster repair protein YtfE (RIC family)
MADLTVNHLRRDHQEARNVLIQLAALLDSLPADARWTSERRIDFEAIGRFFSEDLCSFIRKEDEILYPALRSLFPDDSGPLSVLRAEHRDMCLSFKKLCEIEKSLGVGDNSPETLAGFEHYGRKALEVLQDHLYKEERVLFPMVARFLTPERDAELLRQMELLRAVNAPPPSSDLRS